MTPSRLMVDPSPLLLDTFPRRFSAAVQQPRRWAGVSGAERWPTTPHARHGRGGHLQQRGAPRACARLWGAPRWCTSALRGQPMPTPLGPPQALRRLRGQRHIDRYHVTEITWRDHGAPDQRGCGVAAIRQRHPHNPAMHVLGRAVAGRLVAANLSSGSNGDEGGTGIVAHSPELPSRRKSSACTVPRVSYVGTPPAVRLPEVTRMCDGSHESVGHAGGAGG